MGTGRADPSGQTSSERTNSWEHKPSKAVVYDPTSHKLSTEDVSVLDSMRFLAPTE